MLVYISPLYLLIAVIIVLQKKSMLLRGTYPAETRSSIHLYGSERRVKQKNANSLNAS